MSDRDRHISALEAPVVVASNRGPITYGRDERGRLVPSKGSGGLVTAMSGVFVHEAATWVAAAMSDEDVEIARGGRAVGGPTQRVRFVHIPPDRFDLYYNEFSNRVLWFVHHYLWDVPRTPVFGAETYAAWDAYGDANGAFARELAKEARRDPVYLVQDYHLTLVPRLLREIAPDARIVHYSHTPFAGAQYLRILPYRIREEVIRGMAGADLLGFQSRAWAENFLLAARHVPGLHVDLRRGRVELPDGHETQVRVFPVAVNPHALREASETPQAVAAAREIDELRGGRKLLLRVDRLEPSKNIVRGFLAFEQFLRQHKEWRGKVTFLALLSPTREKLTEYQVYADDCLSEAQRINEEFARGGWTPIVTRVQEDFLYAVGAYSAYDALIVNTVFDGMNLVAMEGPLMNQRDGALVLSRNAGAVERIGRYALTTNPFDVQETADAIHAALELPLEDRQRRARGITRSVLAHTPESWLWAQLEGIDAVLRRRAS